MYAYGVVLLELLTAAEVVDTRRPAACHNLVDWLYSKLHDPTAIQQVLHVNEVLRRADQSVIRLQS